MEFTLADWTVDPDRSLIRKGDSEIRLESSIMRLLEFLAENPGEILSRSRIVEGAWDGRKVAPGALMAAISVLRTALGDHPDRPRLIQTVPRQGYRLLARPLRAPVARRRAPLPQRWPIVFMVAVAVVTWLQAAFDHGLRI